jgi:sugar (pentulose or hexulose) kinase
MLADILGYAVAPVAVTAASGLGAALLGARAAGLAGRIAPPPVAGSSVTVPCDAYSELYRERHHAYARKVLALRETNGTPSH